MEAETPMTAKELRYALNARLAGRRGPGTCVSEKTVKRWVQRWVVAGLVEESVVRQVGATRGRPCTTFSVKAPITEPPNVQKYPLFFENGSGGRDLNFGQGSDKNVQKCEVSKNPEDETAQRDTVSHETRETVPSVENLGKNTPEMAPGFLDILDTEEGLSKNPTPETLSSAGIPENASGFLDTVSGVYRDPVSTQDYAEWDDTGWDGAACSPLLRYQHKALADSFRKAEQEGPADTAG
jgi:hypothetical protein